MKIPEPAIAKHEGIFVLRDDLLPGGTKRRALPVLLAGNAQEYVYTSPVYGYAQIALAHTAKAAKKRVTIFCAARRVKHPRTLEAIAAGANVIEVPCGYMSVVQKHARDYCPVFNSDRLLLPFGLDTPVFINELAGIARSLPIRPTEVWTVVGSGCLSRALQLAWPRAAFHAVRVGAEPNAGRAKLYVAPEKFEQDARLPPPFPSCINYDAKAWRFIQAHARPGALFWNVAA